MFTSEELISSFKPISLEAMDGVKLLDRVDTKYIFGIADLPSILEKLVPDYYILEAGQKRVQHYETVYFDTEDYRLYLNHHNKRMNRYKVRCRKYLDTEQCYFEIKFKNNKCRTNKKRCKHPGPQELIDGKSEKMLAEGTSLTPAMLKPSLWVNFSRITLVNHDMTERATIDTGLSYRDDSGTCEFSRIVIAEIKQERSKQSLFAETLHAAHINSSRISKYCAGIASLNKTVKKNNFKKKLHIINKFNHDLN